MSENARGIIANEYRLDRLMEEDGLGAIVVRSPINVTYLAGVAYPGTLGRHLEMPTSPRPTFVVWPRNGTPAIVVDRIAEELTRERGRIDDVAVFDGYREKPFEMLEALIRERIDPGERVGLEREWLPIGVWRHLKERLHDYVLVDIASLMDRVRWIKTEAEVARLRAAADLLNEALLEVFSTIRAGDSERQVHARVVGACLERGASSVHGMLNADRNTVLYGGESDLELGEGDVIRADYVAYKAGYPGHQSRNAIVGRASSAHRFEYAQYRDIYLRTVGACRPGREAREVYRTAQKAFAEQGWRYDLGLVGHGVGPWWHQQRPILTATNETVLREGMVLAVEPVRSHWHLQDLFLLKAQGPELLSARFPTEEPFAVG